jgi:hypothetical protein
LAKLLEGVRATVTGQGQRVLKHRLP